MRLSPGWRVWLGFELRPGITASSTRDMSGHWRALAAACRTPDGKLDALELDRWTECLVEYSHLWSDA